MECLTIGCVIPLKTFAILSYSMVVSPKSTTIPWLPSVTFEPLSMVTVKSLTFSRWLKWLKCKCALDGWRKQMESWYFAKWIASARIPEICSLVLQDISDVRRCPWILTRNEWWYTFTLANFRGDEGSGRVGRQGQGLSSHQFCPGSQQSTMAGIQRFNQSVNKEVPFKPNPFPTC